MKTPSIYFAGKITKERRDKYRITLNPSDMSDYCDLNKVISESIKCDGFQHGYNLLGAIVIGDDHGCFHGDTSHGIGIDGQRSACIDACSNVTLSAAEKRRMCLERCKTQIQASDVVIAEINGFGDCYGTLMEIGYAHALNKDVIIVFDQPNVKQNQEFWFSLQMSKSKKLITDYHYLFGAIPILKKNYGTYANYINVINTILHTPSSMFFDHDANFENLHCLG
jgi:hypothetical protein